MNPGLRTASIVSTVLFFKGTHTPPPATPAPQSENWFNLKTAAEHREKSDMIFDLLASGMSTTGELRKSTGMAISTISNMLREMRDEGRITRETGKNKRGIWRVKGDGND